jgi:hypothetical protein
MNTTIELGGARDASLLCGSPLGRGRGSQLLFGPGQIVALYLASSNRLYVIRTGSGCTHLPGVSPRVELLLDAQTKGRIDLCRRLLRGLGERGYELTSLPDSFFLRLHAIIAGARRAHALRTLLELEGLRA